MKPALRVVGEEAATTSIDIATVTPASIDQALSGDPAAMRRLVSALRPVIHAEVAWTLERFAPHGRGRDPHQEVRDTIQEVFVALLERDGKILRNWNPDKGRSLRSFTKLVTRHQVASLLRSNRRCPWTEDPTPAELMPVRLDNRGEARIVSADAARRIVQALRATLSTRSMLMFEGLYIEERSVDEVCDQLGITRDAVYAWRRRIRIRIDDLAKRLGLEGM